MKTVPKSQVKMMSDTAHDSAFDVALGGHLNLCPSNWMHDETQVGPSVRNAPILPSPCLLNLTVMINGGRDSFRPEVDRCGLAAIVFRRGREKTPEIAFDNV